MLIIVNVFDMKNRSSLHTHSQNLRIFLNCHKLLFLICRNATWKSLLQSIKEREKNASKLDEK
jgi:hypothetical protein